MTDFLQLAYHKLQYLIPTHIYDQNYNTWVWKDDIYEVFIRQMVARRDIRMTNFLARARASNSNKNDPTTTTSQVSIFQKRVRALIFIIILCSFRLRLPLRRLRPLRN